MHGRIRSIAALAAIAISLAASPAALAEPMPAGPYDVTISGGTIQAGTLLPPAQLPSAGPLAVSIGTSQIQLALPAIATIPGNFSSPVAGGTLSGTYTVTVPTADLAVDPATGSATLDVALYVALSVQYTGYVTLSTTCNIGNANDPVLLHLTTDAGSAWSAAAGNFSLADNTFAVSAPTCANGTVQSVLALVMGGTGSGSNSAHVDGHAAPHRAAPAPAPTSGLAPTTLNDGANDVPPALEPEPGTEPAAHDEQLCIVPKLKGKSLERSTRMLRRAGCRVGRVSRVRSKKRPGTVVRQRVAPGTRLPRGTRIGVGVASSRG